MFGILRILGGFFVNNPIIKFIMDNWFKILISLVVAASVYLVYDGITSKFKELDKAKEELNAAKVEIDTQRVTINNLAKDIKLMQDSNKITISILKDMQETQVNILNKSRISSAKVKDKVTQIDSSTVPIEQKQLEKSTLFIDDINSAYCEAKPLDCIQGEKK